MPLAVVASCNLNQWAMDFQGNLHRIRSSIAKAKNSFARYRIGPELETSGYGCEDHFHELDTFYHSWEIISELIKSGDSNDILLDIGAPVMHHGVSYNCRILILNGNVLMIRPKMDLADDGNYREARWFRAWSRSRPVEPFIIPDFVRKVSTSGAMYSPIGPAILEFADGITVGCETCEELWTPRAPNVDLCLEGVDIIGNGSASHHVLRKLHSRVELLQSATSKGGGIYVYANQIGCDGGRLYYDGSALIALNGDILKQATQFTVATEAEVITAVVDIDDVRSYRNGKTSRGVQAATSSSENPLHRIRVNDQFSICVPRDQVNQLQPTAPLQEVYHCNPQEEIARGPACWLWDYVRRSGMNGFFLPLSGGADSSSTAAIVGSMCQMLVEEACREDCEDRLLDDIRRVAGEDEHFIPRNSRELANRIFHTMYMGSKDASSKETRDRAAKLSDEIGANHMNIDIHGVVEAILQVFATVFGGDKRPKFKTHGGSSVENLALQNIQARTRMVLGYLFAQLTLWAKGRSGSLLVLGSANVDEGLRGYLTKYDCSSADINPIGGISKADLRSFLRWAADKKDGLGYLSLMDVVEAVPTAELEPLTEEYTQTDEDDMGMTYEELSWYGRLRKLQRCGPVAMYNKLKYTWTNLNSIEVAQKVKFFFRMYSINRHKLTTLTPSYHAENYSPEDNRFDLRQFLYNARWSWQFSKIDEQVELDIDE